jgi:hypothetical protein
MSEDISNLRPASGRFLNESGGRANLADELEAWAEVDARRASRAGLLFRTFWQGTVPNGSTYYFAFDIPSGIRLIGVARYDTIIDGELDVTFGIAASLGTAQETLSGYNFDEVDGASPQAVFKRYDTVTGFSARTPTTRLYAPSSGPDRYPATQTSADIRPVFNQSTIPVLRFVNSSGSDVDLHTYLIWQEVAG